MDHILLIALDSIGIDPLGHNRPESVYAKSRLLFSAGMRGPGGIYAVATTIA